jgi:hypothetical protein
MRQDDKEVLKGWERGNWSGVGKIGTNRCFCWKHADENYGSGTHGSENQNRKRNR